MWINYRESSGQKSHGVQGIWRAMEKKKILFLRFSSTDCSKFIEACRDCDMYTTRRLVQLPF